MTLPASPSRSHTHTNTHSRCQAGFTHQWTHCCNTPPSPITSHLLVLFSSLLPCLFGPSITPLAPPHPCRRLPPLRSPSSQPFFTSFLLIRLTTSHTILEDFQSKQNQFNSIRKRSARTWMLPELCDYVSVSMFMHTCEHFNTMDRCKLDVLCVKRSAIHHTAAAGF